MCQDLLGGPELPAGLPANPTLPVSLFIFPYFFPFLLCMHVCCAMCMHWYLLACMDVHMWAHICQCMWKPMYGWSRIILNNLSTLFTEVGSLNQTQSSLIRLMLTSLLPGLLSATKVGITGHLCAIPRIQIPA